MVRASSASAVLYKGCHDCGSAVRLQEHSHQSPPASSGSRWESSISRNQKSTPTIHHNQPTATTQVQPTEPILVPKLRIYFADFPYLHFSTDQRLFTLETCCGYGYGLERGQQCNSLGFSRVDESALDTARAAVLYAGCDPISG